MSEVDEMSVEVVTVRDGRGHTHARVFVDGAEVPAVLYDIATPGAGWTPSMVHPEGIRRLGGCHRRRTCDVPAADAAHHRGERRLMRHRRRSVSPHLVASSAPNRP